MKTKLIVKFWGEELCPFCVTYPYTSTILLHYIIETFFYSGVSEVNVLTMVLLLLMETGDLGLNTVGAVGHVVQEYSIVLENVIIQGN